MSISLEKHSAYRFGDFTLDTSRAALLHDDDEIPLRPQSFEVLHHLVANHGRLITKDELLEEVWRGRAVTDDSLTQCLIDIRRAIGDDDRSLVRTVPRRGYIFEAPVTVAGSDLPRTDATTVFNAGRWRLIAASAALAIALLIWVFGAGPERSGQSIIENSIAVLPLVDMSASQDQQYLGEGIAEDILNALAQNPSLKVIARTSSFSFAAQSMDIAEIRDALNVEYVLTGSVRRTGELLRISVELSETENSTLVWAQPLETQLSDLVGIEQYIAESVQTRILPDVQAVIADPPGKSFSAKDLMYLARRLERQLYDRPEIDESVLQEAIELYRRAVGADPKSAQASARLARVLLFAGQLSEATPYANQAMILDPNSSEVQETLGRLYWAQNNPAAGGAWLRAIQLNPNNADALSSYGYWHWIREDQDIPADYFRAALDLDPLSLARYSDLGYFLGNEARIDEVEEVIEQIRQRFDSADSYRAIAKLLELIGRVDESIAWTLRAIQKEPSNRFHVAQLAEYYADIGDFETALQLDPAPLGLLIKLRNYEDFIDKAAFEVIDNPDDVYLRYLLAFAYNVTQQSHVAIGNFERLGVKPDWTKSARAMYDIEASLLLADAIYASGDTERARQVATVWMSERHTDSANWWVHVYSACALSIMDRDDEALDELDLVRQSPRLPWKHLIQDMVCFRKFKAEDRYIALLAHIDERLAAMREKLPQTLARFGVSPLTPATPR